ncbi:sugar ABC transporter permease [Tyzzerella sp. OttesenSCG-928-J15]|nr:sugar ABC transporter permease [Tyzzerella sp. OttesenSCG-928-J15]
MIKKPNFKIGLFMVPGLVGFIIFYIIPVLFSMNYALTDSPVNGQFVGLENFRKVLQSPPFLLAVKNTLKFMIVSIPLNMAIPLALAVLLEKVDNRRIITTIFMSPLVIPSACIAFLFQSFFASNGLLSSISAQRTNWMQTETSFAIACLIYIWKNMGYNLVLYLAGLSSIPKDYYEWASMEGMGGIRFFFTIKLRYLMPTLFIVFVMSFINSFKVYRELYMLGGNYPNDSIYMLQHYMNNQFNRLSYQNLTAASFLIIGVISIFVLLFFIADKKSSE